MRLLARGGWGCFTAAATAATARAAPAVARLQSNQRRTAVTRALVLNKADDLELRNIAVEEPFTDDDVRIDIHKVGICGSDIHYYEHGCIPPFFLQEPMILGHEASGIVTEIGKNVKHLRVGDRVCMEPGVPDFRSEVTLKGMYNLDPNVRFWATPPPEYATQINGDDSPWRAGHGCLRPSVVHPGAFTFKLPDSVSLEVGALVEPLAVGMHAATKAQIKPGDTAAVLGAGPIGMMTILSALAGGCSTVFVSDLSADKVAIAEKLAPAKVKGFVASGGDEFAAMRDALGGRGPDVVFECAGHHAVAANAVKLVGIGGRVILIGCAAEPIPLEAGQLMVKEVTMTGIFRYAGVYPAAINLLASGAIDLSPVISKHWTFEDSVEAFDFARNPPPDVVKNIIHVRE